MTEERYVDITPTWEGLLNVAANLAIAAPNEEALQGLLDEFKKPLVAVDKLNLEARAAKEATIIREKDRELVEKTIELIGHPDDVQELLDTAVHGEASKRASEINNGGQAKQLDYLLEIWSAEELCDMLTSDYTPPGESDFS